MLFSPSTLKTDKNEPSVQSSLQKSISIFEPAGSCTVLIVAVTPKFPTISFVDTSPTKELFEKEGAVDDARIETDWSPGSTTPDPSGTTTAFHSFVSIPFLKSSDITITPVETVFSFVMFPKIEDELADPFVSTENGEVEAGADTEISSCVLFLRKSKKRATPTTSVVMITVSRAVRLSIVHPVYILQTHINKRFLDKTLCLDYYCGKLIHLAGPTSMDTEKLWKSVLSEIELSVSKATFQTHFANSRLLSVTSGVATVGFTNPLMKTLVETRYYSLVKSILDHHTQQNISLVFAVVPKKETLSQKDAGPLFSPTYEEPSLSVASVAKRLHIRPDATFENFAVSTSNQMAYAAATAVARSPGTAYNPLFIYGGVGVGKTHLMHAVANAMLAKKPNARVVYCMGEEFLNEIIEAIQTKTARQFKQKYRTAQLFLVDDVQFIAGKQTAQEEFFHTFNAVHREGGQIILISDRPPSEISKLEDRLRSRFEGGLTVDISSPDFELRVAIINIKSAASGLVIPQDAAKLIAANITDTRAIEGFLRRLTSESSTRKLPITTEFVSGLLRIKSPAEETKKLRIVPSQDVLTAVADYFGIKPTALKGPKRDRPLSRPRQVFMYLCRTELGLTLNDIGGAIGGRDHTTIMHGVETVTREMSTNEGLRTAVEGIKRVLWK